MRATLQDFLRFRAVMLAIVMLGVQFFMIPSAPTSTVSSSMAPTSVEDRIHLPGDYFTGNAGQLRNEDVLFYSSSGGMQVGFAERSVLIKIVEDPPISSDLFPHGMSSMDVESTRRGVLIRITFQGANPVQPQGRYELPHRSNFFLGNDPSKWRTDVKSYREIVYENLYEGIDLVYRMGREGLKYDFIVHPGGDPALILMAYEGIESLDVSPESLVLRTETGEVRDEGIVVTAGDDSVRCEFAHRGIHAAGFDCAGWDPAHLLIIDPLLWATFLGGIGEYDRASALALDTFGDPIMAGWTKSANFPATAGAYDVTLNGPADAFLAKLSADGSSLLWATFLGGGDYDGASALALDTFGDPLMAGSTKSANFPATPGGYDVTLNGSSDAFLAKLSADGSSLLWATFLGGTNLDDAFALAFDAFGNPVVAGSTTSADFPATAGGYDVTLNGSSDAFLAKLSADGSSLLWATFLGGDGDDVASSLALDAFGDPLMAGWTYSANFPATAGGYDVTLNGPSDAFLAKLSADGSSLLWATFLGGNAKDGASVLTLDAFGDPIVAGWTYSVDFPATPGAYDVTLNGSSDAFLAKLSADGSSLLWATFLGGNAEDGASVLTLDAFGDPIVAGWTYSVDFPATPGAYDISHNGGQDAFVVKLKLVIVMPDLEVTQGDISLDPPGPVAFATDVTINATVHNIGDDNASQVVVRFHDGPPSGSNQIGLDQMIPLITYFGGTGVASVLWTAGPPGMHDICAVADPDNLVMEWNETNNMACVPMEVLGPPPPRPPANLSAILSGKDSQNVTLAWDLSPDDGGGANNVVAYDIHRNTSFDSRGRGYVLYDSVPNGTNTYTDVLAGEGDPSDYFYYACAVSNANLSSCTMNQAGKFTRPLSQGPNLISIPLIQSNESIETVLQTVEYHKAWYCDSSSQEWKWYMTSKGYRRGLWNMDRTMGIWVNVTENSNLTAAGIVPAQTTIHLYEGWNLVSFPSFNATYTIADLKVEIGVTRVEGMETMPPFPPSRLKVLADLDALRAGYGYWVRVEADVDWIVEVA